VGAVGKRGPIGKSAWQALLDGNPGKRPLRAPAPSGPPLPPDTEPAEWLTPEAKAEWRRILPAAPWLSKLDVTMLQLYVEAWSDFQRASAIVHREGFVIRDRRGVLRKHPAARLQTAARVQVKTFAADLGFTPAARARLGFDRGP